jgi:hypothetical protein
MGQHEPQSARNGRKTLEAREERVQSDAVILSKKKKSATIQKVVRTRALTGPPENTSGQVFKMVEIPSKKRARQLTCEDDLARDEDQQC